jgi:muconolactone delta-isomerase
MRVRSKHHRRKHDLQANVVQTSVSDIWRIHGRIQRRLYSIDDRDDADEMDMVLVGNHCRFWNGRVGMGGMDESNGLEDG